jgi:Mg-chelatase subunit ChlD
MKLPAPIRGTMIALPLACALAAAAWLAVAHHRHGVPPAATPARPAAIVATVAPTAQHADAAAPPPAASSAAPAVPPRKTYPVGQWDMPVPFINPFGAQQAYTSVEHQANGRFELRYIDRRNMEALRTTAGELWQIEVPWHDSNAGAMDDLKRYLAALGAETWLADGEGGLAIHARDGAGDDWWGTALPHGAGYTLWLCRELVLRPGKPLAFHTRDFKRGVLYFSTTNPRHVFQSLEATLGGGQAMVIGRNTYRQGHYRRDTNYNRTLYAYKTPVYTLDGIPQDGSLPIQWEVSWHDDSDPKELDFALEEGEPIAPVRDGEALGALKVRGVGLGQVHVKIPDGLQLTHPELSLVGDLTPEGDALFWLPSGYWNVEVRPDGRKLVSGTLLTRLVPVSSGEMTVLDAGPLIERAYRNPEVGDASGDEGRLRILQATAQGDQASVAFELQGAGTALVPDAANTRITEGGMPAKLLKLERVRTPPSVVLALDSSGSMRGSMKRVLDAARGFIKQLPDSAHIQVIDFDSQIRVLKGSGKAEVLRSLAQVGVGGSTTLYDAVLKGLKLLDGRQRPTLVVFTDGVDSREDHQGRGSDATRAQVESAVAASKVPLFTIGFGAGHDGRTLKELAVLSGGTYYSADDTDAAQHVFDAIGARLGNRFVATYQRPQEAAPSDQPVITLATDVSLSMDIAPSTHQGNYRFDKMKNLFHGFIERIPADSLVQLISFCASTEVDQVFTTRKPDLLQALGGLEVGMGTDILGSVQQAYLSLRQVPAEKRVIVYLTDAALDVDRSDKPAFEKLLKGIRDDGIQVLWIGMGTGEAEDAFRQAAQLSGGKYVISEDPQVLAQALQELLANAKARPAARAQLTVAVGPGDRYTDSRLLDFPVLRSATRRVAFDTLAYRTGLKAPQYGADAAATLYGRDLPHQDVRVYKRLPLDASAKNGAIAWHIREAYLMKRFRGVDAPGNQSFLALDMTLKNIEPRGAPYLIPDFASHFFVTQNREGSWPASPATWLAETPLAAPGENEVRIAPGQTLHGALVFMVPDDTLTQLSAEFYDTAYGHIVLPLVGEAPKHDVALDALPRSAAGKLAGTFAMRLAASRDMDRIEDVAAGDDSFFRVLETRFDSKVQADLKLAPWERFRLAVDTPAGPFMLPVSGATDRLPLGFMWPVTLAPGSSNTVRFAFQLPKALRDAPASLYFDLAGGAATLPAGGKPLPAPAAAPVAQTYPGDGVALTVNAVGHAAPSSWPYGDYVIADVTVANTRPGAGVSGLREGFRLAVQGAVPEGAPRELSPDAITDGLLFGIDPDWVVFDGTRRRGLLVFSLPPKWAKLPLVLRSSQFKDLALPVPATAYAETALLEKRVEPKADQRFEHALALALKDAIARQRALAATHQAAAPATPDARAGAQEAAAPRPALDGAARLRAVATWDDAQALLRSLRWLPSADDYWHYRNAPESVLAQGWGSEGDLANLAGGLLARLGYSPSLRAVAVTDAGRQALKTLGHLDEATEKYLPAWAYLDAQGQPRLWVVPFMRDLSELDGLAYLPGGQEDRAMTPQNATLRVYFTIRPRRAHGLNATAGTMAGALAGGGPTGDGTRDVRVLSASLPLDTLGREPLDIRVGAQHGRYTAVVENQTLQIPGNDSIDPQQAEVTGALIELDLPGRMLEHRLRLRKDEDITGTFFTLGLNLPDLSTAAADALRKAADRIHDAVAKPTVHGALAWYTRGILYRFVGAQTRYEEQLARQLGVTAGRTDRERALLVTVRRAKDSPTLRTSLDLMQSANQLHHGEADARHAFNLASGLFASHLEGAVLPGDGADFMTLWRNSPDGTDLLLSLPSGRQDDLAYMRAQGMPATLVERAKRSGKVLLAQSKPARIDGEDHWAWLEIDPDTYETIAVTDTGEHGSFADYVMATQPVAPTGNDYLQFMVGGFIGVDTAVWSVGSFSLESSDYKAVLAAARAYTAQLGQVLDGVKTLKDVNVAGVDLGVYKAELSADVPDVFAQSFEEAMGKSTPKAGIKQNVLTFTNGFRAGAAYYFKQAEQPAGP